MVSDMDWLVVKDIAVFFLATSCKWECEGKPVGSHELCGLLLNCIQCVP